jgi:hypothetical protein
MDMTKEQREQHLETIAEVERHIAEIKNRLNDFDNEEHFEMVICAVQLNDNTVTGAMARSCSLKFVEFVASELVGNDDDDEEGESS